MAEYNKVILLGRLTRDPQLRFSPSGTAVCEFPLATHFRYRVQDELREDVCYVDVVVFGKAGQSSTERLRKGSRVLVEGRLAQRWWETQAGQRRSKYEVIAYTVQFIDAASGSDEEELPLKAEE